MKKEDQVYTSPRALFTDVVLVIREMHGFKASLRTFDSFSSENRFELDISHNGVPTTFSIVCNGYQNQGKAVIRHKRPSKKDNLYIDIWHGNVRVPSPEMKVSLTKTPEQIAKDLFRRIYDESVKLSAEAEAIIKRDNEFTDAKLQMIEEVAKIFDTVPEKHYRTGEVLPEVNPFMGLKEFGQFGYGKVIVNSSDSIEFDVKSMGKDFALDVLRAFRSVVEKYKNK